MWAYAKQNGLTIVSKDSDFHQRSLVEGPPPKVVWVPIGSCTTSDIERTLRRHQRDLEELETDPSVAFLIID